MDVSGAQTFAFTPTNMGVGVVNNTSAVAFQAAFLHFRYSSSATKLFGGTVNYAYN